MTLRVTAAELDSHPSEPPETQREGALHARAPRAHLSAAASRARRCAAGSAIEILQEKWVLHIVHALLSGPKGFNELGREVGGCNPTTLTARLARLEELGVVEREPHPGSPPRFGYALTPSGRELERVILAIRTWAVAHLPGGE